MDLIIRNARLSTRPADAPLDIGIANGRIVAIGSNTSISKKNAIERICQSRWLP